MCPDTDASPGLSARANIAELDSWSETISGLWCLSAVVCLHFPGERLVFCRQFEQRHTDLFIGDPGGDAPIPVGIDEQVGGDVHERQTAPAGHNLNKPRNLITSG